MKTYSEKKILIIGGAQVHCKLVEAAKRKGCHTIVIDNLPEKDSPAKQIADEHYEINIFDIDSILALCRQKSVEAVLSTHLDPCQIPYNTVCERLRLPCYGSREQFAYLTDKKLFKQLCIQNGLEITQEYESMEAVDSYPVFVKPVDSRGSRGQAKCGNYEEMRRAVETAERESKSGQYVIEKFYEGYAEIQVTYYFVNGKPCLIRTADSYKGHEEQNLGNVITYGVSPSEHTGEYLKTVNDRVIKMLRNIGIENGPVMIQGFFREGSFYMFDQGLRFPGVDYERCYREVFGIDLLEPMIDFAMTGVMEDILLDDMSVYLDGRQFRTIFPLLREGRIAKIEGVEAVKAMPHVKAFLERKKAGDVVQDSNDINRRFAEIDVLADDNGQIDQVEKAIREKLAVTDVSGGNLLIPWR